MKSRLLALAAVALATCCLLAACSNDDSGKKESKGTATTAPAGNEAQPPPPTGGSHPTETPEMAKWIPASVNGRAVEKGGQMASQLKDSTPYITELAAGQIASTQQSGALNAPALFIAAMRSTKDADGLKRALSVGNPTFQKSEESVAGKRVTVQELDMAAMAPSQNGQPDPALPKITTVYYFPTKDTIVMAYSFEGKDLALAAIDASIKQAGA